MTDDARRGAYRIQAVAQMTGIPEPTLRAWERRYGIPRPERTASGYRLYGEVQLEQARAMRKLCEGGMAAAEAAEVVRASAAPAPPKKARAQRAADPHQATIQAMLEAVSRFDQRALETELQRLLFLGSASVLLDRVVMPFLVQIGQLWHEGKLSVAHEHFASQHVATLLRDVLRLVAPPPDSTPVIFAAFADDQHELGLLGAALRFASWGYRPIFLGARSPPGAVRDALEGSGARLVALSYVTVVDSARARELVDDYAAACTAVPWIVGGAGAATLADRVRARGGEVAPADDKELLALVRRLLARRATSAAPGAPTRSRR